MTRHLRAIAVRLRGMLRRHAAERELDEELRYHLTQDVERHVRRGLTRDEATRRARAEFGNLELHKEDVRDLWRVQSFGELQRDVRFALRGFRRAPSFVATVVLTIALALGLNTSAFTVFDAYVLRPIAARDPYTLFSLGGLDREGHTYGFSWDDYRSVRELPIASESFAYRRISARVDGRPLFGAATDNALHVLGARTILGRPLLPDDGSPVIVLAHDAWRTRFGADSGIVGRTVIVRGASLTVVGVLAPRAGAFSSMPPDFWVPLRTPLGTDGEPVGVVLRLRTSEATALAALEPWVAGRAREQRAMGAMLPLARARLTPLASVMPRDPEALALFLPILAAFGLVLLIACANVTNVMLARALARQREIGIRLTLGAARGRLLRQLLIESLLLAVPAAALGFVLSRWSIDGGVRLMFASLPADFSQYLRVVPLSPDLRVFGFLLVAAVGSAILFGLLPAIQATRPSVVQAARGNFDQALRPGRLRSVLVVVQITVCATLLITTGVLLRGAARMRSLESGLHTANVIQLRIDERWRAAARQRLGTTPGQLAGALASPLDGSFPTVALRAGGHVESGRQNVVSGDYFDVLGIALVHGRTFTSSEAHDRALVAIVSEAAAQRLWPGRSAIGQGIQIGDGRVAEVIGVARNAVSGWIGTGFAHPVVYTPASPDAPGMQWLVRVPPSRDGVLRERDRIDRMLATVAPSAVEEIHALDEYRAVQIYPFRAFSWVAGALGIVALCLTVLGIYGVLSYLVSQRQRELGIRLALGAARERVVAIVLGHSLRLAVIGLACGALLATAASQIIASTITVLDGFDALGYAGGAAVVLLSCLTAAFAPSRRASRLDPIATLKSE